MKSYLSVLIVSALLISGCSSTNQDAAKSDTEQSNSEISANWLNTKNDAIQAEGKAAFESLIPDYDEFENTGYFDLPKSLEVKIVFGKIVTRFSLLAIDSKGPFRFYPSATVVYTGKDWLFIDSLYLKFGDEVKEFISEGQLRDVLSGANVSEIVPILFNSEESVLFLSKVFNVDSVGVRFGARKVGADDRNLTELELNSLKTVLLAYRYMHQNDLLTAVPKP
jgi:outer membrane murein-binding lipoprotein Lpp